MKKKIPVISIVIALIALFEWSVSVFVPGFALFYMNKIYPVWPKIFGRITSLIPFSIGELLTYFFVLYVAVTLLLWAVRLVLFLLKKKALCRFVNGYTKVFCYALSIFLLVMVNNCFIGYRSGNLYTGTIYDEVKISKDNLVELRNTLANRANEMCALFDRDQKGYIIYEGDIAKEATKVMQEFAESVESDESLCGDEVLRSKLLRLQGFVPKPKYLLFSNFFSQQSIMGYYFPYSMEANINRKMYIANFPSTMCHELAHVKGFILEDEANFISYLACVSSSNQFFQYSGILMLLDYMDIECANDPVLKDRLVELKREVKQDQVFLTKEAYDEMNEKAVFDTETVNKMSQDFLETNLTLQGVEEGTASYNEVVVLALKYYYGDK